MDFIVDMARTGVNVIGNSLAAAVDSSEKRREAKLAHRGNGSGTPHLPATHEHTPLRKETAQ
ncbi:hypothetical protein [Streptomyces sp. NBC_01451]|uniref:hypothetical protein n=1 Tax=Streptomyces sp. NBC_01451 TaxID=2903872 RepID=UPI002E30282F|nr:hypothetical protein [Streptomyces sp. NBC_01451]